MKKTLFELVADYELETYTFRMSPRSWIIQHLHQQPNTTVRSNHYNFHNMSPTEWDRIQAWMGYVGLEGNITFQGVPTETHALYFYLEDDNDGEYAENENDFIESPSRYLESVWIMLSRNGYNLLVQNNDADFNTVASLMKYFAMCYVRSALNSTTLAEQIEYTTVGHNRILIVGPSSIGEMDYLIKSPFVKRLPELDYGSINQ